MGSWLWLRQEMLGVDEISSLSKFSESELWENCSYLTVSVFYDGAIVVKESLLDSGCSLILTMYWCFPGLLNTAATQSYSLRVSPYTWFSIMSLISLPWDLIFCYLSTFLKVLLLLAFEEINSVSRFSMCTLSVGVFFFCPQVFWIIS